jgi:class 3 adenylate cyclase
MSLGDDLRQEVAAILSARWTTRDGNVVPETDSIQLGNSAVKLSGAVLYADLTDSTKLVDTQTASFAAEVYKAFLSCAARIISSEGGAITAYDGDRVMAVFIGNSKCNTAVRTALKIQYATSQIVNPAIKNQYPDQSFQARHVVGIDVSDLFVARTGIRGANDLVWVGRAANYAAKLAAIDEGFSTWITGAVYDVLHDEQKLSNGVSMWEARSWTAMANAQIYRSKYWWRI